MSTELIVIAIYLTLYSFAIARFNNALFLFIFFLPIRSLIDSTILNTLSYNVVFGFIFLFHAVKLGLLKHIGVRSIRPVKSLLSFTIIFFLAATAIAIKERYLLHDNLNLTFSIGWIINRVLILIVSILNFIVIIKSILIRQSSRSVVYHAITASAVIIVFSMFFAGYLESVGINIRESVDEVASYNELMRYSGLYNWGDVNSLSTFLNLVISFVISYLTMKRKNLNYISITILVILISGVIYTLSRMGFITLLIILTYFVLFLNNRLNRFSIKTIVNLALILLGLFITYLIVDHFGRFDSIVYRLMERSITDEVGVGGHRYFRWASFIEYTFSDLVRTLVGSDQAFFVIRHGIWTDPHNFFVSLLYFNGIIMVFLFMRGYLRLYLAMRKIKLSIYFNLFTIILLISLMIISQSGFISVLILYTGILIYELKSKLEY